MHQKDISFTGKNPTFKRNLNEINAFFDQKGDTAVIIIVTFDNGLEVGNFQFRKISLKKKNLKI